ncbi:MAG TPA: glycosyltransferase [Acholeplasmataceae bacterium]|nr:glycosyltransferase [Acholeplasmataceae bacterium]
MRIVELIPSLSFRAGAEVFCVDLACELHNQGAEVFIVCLYDGIEKLFSEKLKKHNIPVIFLNKKRGLDIRCSRLLKRTIGKIDPDIVHMHLGVMVSYFFAFGWRTREWFSVQTIHNIAEKEASRITKFLRKLYLKKNRLYLVSISDLVDKTVKSTYKTNNIFLIYNGVSFKEEKADLDFSNNTLICVARFSKQKNHSMLFEMFDRLSLKRDDLKLICVGDGPLFEEYRCKYAHDDKVIFTGAVSNVNEYLTKSSIFILTSLYEGNPISILEAMNVGLPIVAPRVGGIPDIVKDSVNGFLFEVGNVDECLNSVISLVENPSLMRNIYFNNKTKAKEYSIGKCANSYLNCFNYILKGEKK